MPLLLCKNTLEKKCDRTELYHSSCFGRNQRLSRIEETLNRNLIFHLRHRIESIFNQMIEHFDIKSKILKGY